MTPRDAGRKEVSPMAKPMYVRFEMPKDLVDKTYQSIELAKESGKVRKGTNEVTKLVGRGSVRRHGGGRPARGDPRPHAPPVRGERRALRVRPEQTGARRRGRPRQGDGLDCDLGPRQGEAGARRSVRQAPRDEEVTEPGRSTERRWRTRTASPQKWSRSSAGRG